MHSSLALALNLIAFQAIAQSSLKVEVELNRPDAGGTVRMAICPSADTYDKEKGCILAEGAGKGPLVVLHIADLPPGNYAIKAFHDVNDNGEMDFNWMGVPKEPSGFSNNARATMSAPAFKEAAFPVRQGPNTTRFRMKG